MSGPGGGPGLNQGSPPRVILYVREGCHLCEEARGGLIELGSGRFGFELVEIDIESDELLHRAMLERIPVIEIDGSVVVELGWDEGRVAARLANLGA